MQRKFRYYLICIIGFGPQHVYLKENFSQGKYFPL